MALKDAKHSLKGGTTDVKLVYFHIGGSNNHSVSDIKIKLYGHFLILSYKDCR